MSTIIGIISKQIYLSFFSAFDRDAHNSNRVRRTGLLSGK